MAGQRRHLGEQSTFELPTTESRQGTRQTCPSPPSLTDARFASPLPYRLLPWRSSRPTHWPPPARLGRSQSNPTVGLVARSSSRSSPTAASGTSEPIRSSPTAPRASTCLGRSSSRVHGFLKIACPPIRRHRTPSCPSIWTHSNVARMSGPAKWNVTSQMPGAFSTSLTRTEAGHATFRSAAYRSHAATKVGRVSRTSERSCFERRMRSLRNEAVTSNFNARRRGRTDPRDRPGHRRRWSARMRHQRRPPAPSPATCRSRTRPDQRGWRRPAEARFARRRPR